MGDLYKLRLMCVILLLMIGLDMLDGLDILKYLKNVNITKF